MVLSVGSSRYSHTQGQLGRQAVGTVLSQDRLKTRCRRASPRVGRTPQNPIAPHTILASRLELLDQLASAERTHGGVSAGVPHEDREASIAVLVAAVGETERLKRGDVDGGEREGVSTAQRVPYEDCYVVSCGVAAIPLGRGEVGDVNDSKGRDEDSRSHGDWRSITSTFIISTPAD